MRVIQSSDAVKSYLKSIGQVPLLTHEEEVELGSQVKAMMRMQAMRAELAEDYEQEPTWEQWAERAGLSVAELKRIVHRGDQAKAKMIKANLRLVVSIAKKYTNRGLDLLDLVQEGSIGLSRGVEKFDPQKGYRFSTYAYWWIRQAITRAIAEKSRMIRLPIHITETLNKIKKIQRQFAQTHGRAATPSEIAHHLQISPERVRDCLRHARKTLSLELRVGDKQDSELIDMLEAKGESPEAFTVKRLIQSELDDLLTQLTPQQRDVLTLRYGLLDGKELSLAKVGQQLNISRERVRQIQQQAISRLRYHNKQLEEYLTAV